MLDESKSVAGVHKTSLLFCRDAARMKANQVLFIPVSQTVYIPRHRSVLNSITCQGYAVLPSHIS